MLRTLQLPGGRRSFQVCCERAGRWRRKRLCCPQPCQVGVSLRGAVACVELGDSGCCGVHLLLARWGCLVRGDLACHPAACWEGRWVPPVGFHGHSWWHRTPHPHWPGAEEVCVSWVTWDGVLSSGRRDKGRQKMVPVPGATRAVCRRGCLHAAKQHGWGGPYGAAAFACLPLQPRAHPTEPQCHLAMTAPTDRKGAVGWQRQDPVSCSSCLAPTLPHGVIPPPRPRYWATWSPRAWKSFQVSAPA